MKRLALAACLGAWAASAGAKELAVGIEMGPIMLALNTAREKWQADACLARLEFKQEGKPEPGQDPENYTYLFYSRQDWKQTYTVRTPAFEEASVGRKHTGHHCLGGVELDIAAPLVRQCLLMRILLPVAPRPRPYGVQASRPESLQVSRTGLGGA